MDMDNTPITKEPDLGTAVQFLYKDAFSNGRVFATSHEFSDFAGRLADIFIRIYRLDPMNYAVNEAHVKNEFEKLSLAAITAGERFADMGVALQRLTQTVEELELQMSAVQKIQVGMDRSTYLIQEEPDVEELLG